MVDNYPPGFNPALLDNPMAELRNQIEESVNITYELHVWVEGELIAHKKSRFSGDIVDSIPAAESLVAQKIEELTELRAEREYDDG